MTSLFYLVAVAQAMTPMTVYVRTVDQKAVALPGIEIAAIEVSECRSRTKTSSGVVDDITGNAGLASLAPQRAHAYVTRSASGSGFDMAETCVPSLAGTESRFVQLQLRVDPANTMTLEEPSAGPPERHDRFSALAFTGANRDAHGKYFVIDVNSKENGIYVETPDQRVLSFPRQAGTTFKGADGEIRFVVTRGRVIAMEFMPAHVRAIKRE